MPTKQQRILNEPRVVTSNACAAAMSTVSNEKMLSRKSCQTRCTPKRSDTNINGRGALRTPDRFVPCRGIQSQEFSSYAIASNTSATGGQDTTDTLEDAVLREKLYATRNVDVEQRILSFTPKSAPCSKIESWRDGIFNSFSQVSTGVIDRQRSRPPNSGNTVGSTQQRLLKFSMLPVFLMTSVSTNPDTPTLVKATIYWATLELQGFSNHCFN